MRRPRFWMFATLMAACTGINPEFMPGDEVITPEQFGEVACDAGGKPGHFEGSGGEAPCLVRQCNAQETCNMVSWTCSDEEAVEWRCKPDRADGELCGFRVHCASRRCTDIGDGRKVCGDGTYVHCTSPVGQDGKTAVGKDGLPCGQFPERGSTSCSPPPQAKTCPAKQPCRTDDGCDSGVCSNGRCNSGGIEIPPGGWN